MQEDFLHFIWQYQKFDKKGLATTNFQPVSILYQGRANKQAGADFDMAKVMIANIEWIGKVEVHLRASEWERHQHGRDKHYNSVILHVVWEADKEIYRQDGTAVPTIELKDRVDSRLLHQYKQIIDSQGVISCANQWESIEAIHKMAMLDKALAQRLEQKADIVAALWQANQYDWEETAYQMLVRNMGFKVNQEAFEQLAIRLPHKILAKHTDSILMIEALLLGIAGFLSQPYTDEYAYCLQKEYQFLAHKYQLKEREMRVENWLFAKMRPANFPTMRIAQLAQIIIKIKNIFSFFTQNTLQEILKTLQVSPSSYWERHYILGKDTIKQISGISLGKASAQNIVINTVVPLLAFLAKEKDKNVYLDTAIQYLEQLPAEQNHILAYWQELGMKVKTAFDSQALIEQYKNNCSAKKCLSCNIGIKLLN